MFFVLTLSNEQSKVTFFLGCTAANTRSPRRSASMAELTNHTDTNLFTTLSNEHTLFAGTLRNWGDPLVQGQEPTPVPLCPRCVACKCESLKDLSNSSASLNHHHHHRHVSSCPNIRQYERAKTSSRSRLVNKPKRRAYSCDSFIPLNSHTSLIKQRTEPSPSPPLTQRKKSVSKIPVRISSATSSSTAASEHSSVSSIAENRSFDRKTKIPRPISNPNSTTTNHLFHTNPILSSADEDLDQDR